MKQWFLRMQDFWLQDNFLLPHSVDDGLRSKWKNIGCITVKNVVQNKQIGDGDKGEKNKKRERDKKCVEKIEKVERRENIINREK